MRLFKQHLMILICATFLGANIGFATPVLYKGGTMIAVMMHSDYNYIHSSYSLTSDYAAGVTYEEFRNDNVNDRYYYLQNNYLLKRFFQDDSQGNIYAKFGAGYREVDKNIAYYGGLQGDWETRTFYTALGSDMLAIQNEITELQTNFRIGVSPYEAKYDEMQAWLILQLGHNIHKDKKFEITPMMRFFHKTALWEIGSDLEGNWMMHFMIHL